MRELVFDDIVLIFEHIHILINYRISCRFFETYPGSETIARIHINVNFQAFTNIKKQDFLIMFYNLKIITALKNQNINIVLFLQYRFNK